MRRCLIEVTDQQCRYLPVGAEIVPGEGVHFRVWAPKRKKVEAVLWGESPAFFEMRLEGNGYFEAVVPQASAGSLYKYRLDDGDWYPDPASRFQPRGPHHFSEVIDPSSFEWTDSSWRGISMQGQVFYEMHIGTFTPEGTFAAAERELPNLRDLGITAVEVMPIAEFPGEFGWGYDGVHPYAPTRLYGRPDDVRHFADTAHGLGLGVILDVVYNHLGPDGNYLPAFSPYYFTNDHKTDWGEAINYYAKHSGPVREFFIANAGYWIAEFHFDGLRVDATDSIHDQSKEHLLSAMVREVRRAGSPKSVVVIGENEPQDPRLVDQPEKGGYGLDALWNDDIHHAAVVRLTGRKEAFLSDYSGTPQEFVSIAKYGFLFQGQRYRWQKKRRGKPARNLSPRQFVNFLQNHDQISNSARGLRIHQRASPGNVRAMAAFVVLAPGTPMLFQGEEFAASAPFPFFADCSPELVPLVRKGRRQYLAQFRSIATPDMADYIPDPCSRETFERSKLDYSEREKNHAVWIFYRDLLQLRGKDPAFQVDERGAVDGAILSPDAFFLRYFEPKGNDRLLVVNFGIDLQLATTPEPLLAPPSEAGWEILWSSESPQYGGSGIAPLETAKAWKIPGQSATVLRPVDEVGEGGPCT